MSSGIHDAWVNSAALAAAGIDRSTPDPLFGRIERTADGEPQGTLHEGAVRLVEATMPATTTQEHRRAILAAQAHLHRLGVTAWQDAWTTPETLAAYQSLAKDGSLTARVVAALWWDRYQDGRQMEWFRTARRESRIGRLRATSVKIMQDGVTGNMSAAVLEPYFDESGAPTSNVGTSYVEPELLKSHVSELDADGFQVHFHAIGERAVREALDAIEAARVVGRPRDNRHHISHVCLVHPDDIPRFGPLGVTANIQPYWAVDGVEMREENVLVGPVRAGWWYPFESLRRAGARLAGGSDWSVSTANPFEMIEVAVTRVDPARRGSADPYLAHERLSVRDALAAFTSGGAYVNHLDEAIPGIEVGALADLVVVDRDPLAPSDAPLGSIKVLMTIVGGAVVHRDTGVDWG